jgi:hypothetical protein
VGGMRWVCIASVIALIFGVAGCGVPGAQSGPVAARPSQVAQVSADATTDARAAVTGFLSAWQARDIARANSLATARRVFSSASASDFPRIEVVGTATPLPYTFEPDMQRPDDPTYVDARAFGVPVRLWGFSPGAPGERVNLTWVVVKTADGRWLVWDWGY